MPQDDAEILAEAFFSNIRRFSADALRQMGLPPLSPNGGTRAETHGIVLHFTVSPHAKPTLRWLCDPASRSSAHFVIARDRLLSPDDAPTADVAAYRLPASIVALRPLSSSAWHATWANAWSIGIEICNAGEIRRDAKGQAHTFDPSLGWQPATIQQTGEPLLYGARQFCNYTEGQFLSLRLLLFALTRKLSIPPSMLFGHEHVQGRNTPASGAHDKRDVGGLDMMLLRAQTAASDAQTFWQSYQDAVHLPVDKPSSSRLFRKIQVDEKITWARRNRARSGDFAACCGLLDELGYAVAPNRLKSDGLRPTEKSHVQVFQHMMGLNSDGILGPLTGTAISLRHHDRFGAAAPVERGEGGNVNVT